MILVKAYIAQSKIHGLGLFAAELIPRGTRTWEFTLGLDQLIDKSIVRTWPRHKRIEILNLSGMSPTHEQLVLCGDNGRFINHSDDANTDFDDTGAWANRDIHIGEEITEDYRGYGKHRLRQGEREGYDGR